jgi:hypothetical protein
MMQETSGTSGRMHRFEESFLAGGPHSEPLKVLQMHPTGASQFMGSFYTKATKSTILQQHLPQKVHLTLSF